MAACPPRRGPLLRTRTLSVHGCVWARSAPCHPRLGRTALHAAPGTQRRSLMLLAPRRHVILPHDVAKLTPKGRLLTETEWRQIGVQQSRGWEHYAIHK